MWYNKVMYIKSIKKRIQTSDIKIRMIDIEI